MKKTILLLITPIMLCSLQSSNKLKTIKTKAVFNSEAFKLYKKNILACKPCYLEVKMSTDSVYYKGIATRIENGSHHFYGLKHDTIIHKSFPSLNQKIISTWEPDSIKKFILKTPTIRRGY